MWREIKRGFEASVQYGKIMIAAQFIEITLTQMSEPAPDTLQSEPEPIELPTKPTVPMSIEPFESGLCPWTKMNAIAVTMRLRRPIILDLLDGSGKERNCVGL